MKNKKNKPSKKQSKVMAYDIFERKYRKSIETLTERILDVKPDLNTDNYDDVYDDSYEEAVYVLASEKHIALK